MNEDMKNIIAQAPTGFPAGANSLRNVMPPPTQGNVQGNVPQTQMMNGVTPQPAPAAPDYGFGMGVNQIMALANSKKYAAAARPLYALAGQMSGDNANLTAEGNRLGFEKEKYRHTFDDEGEPNPDWDSSVFSPAPVEAETTFVKPIKGGKPRMGIGSLQADNSILGRVTQKMGG